MCLLFRGQVRLENANHVQSVCETCFHLHTSVFRFPIVSVERQYFASICRGSKHARRRCGGVPFRQRCRWFIAQHRCVFEMRCSLHCFTICSALTKISVKHKITEGYQVAICCSNPLTMFEVASTHH